MLLLSDVRRWILSSPRQYQFTTQITETNFVIAPCKEKLNRTVQSLLEHCPPPTGCCLVTKHIKGRQIVRFDGVHRLFFHRICRFLRSFCHLQKLQEKRNNWNFDIRRYRTWKFCCGDATCAVYRKRKLETAKKKVTLTLQYVLGFEFTHAHGFGKRIQRIFSALSGDSIHRAVWPVRLCPQGSSLSLQLYAAHFPLAVSLVSINCSWLFCPFFFTVFSFSVKKPFTKGSVCLPVSCVQKIVWSLIFFILIAFERKITGGFVKEKPLNRMAKDEP